MVVDLSLQVASIALQPSLEPHRRPSLIQFHIRLLKVQEAFKVVALLGLTLAHRGVQVGLLSKLQKDQMLTSSSKT